MVTHVEKALLVPELEESCPGLTSTSSDHVELHLLQHDHQHWTKKALVPFLVLILVQFLTATFQTLSKVALTSGIDTFFFTFYRNVVAFLVLAPFAFYLERDVRPKLTLHTIVTFNLLAFFAILANQQLFLAGLALTSTLFTGVSQNLVPVITFLLATLFGMERVSIRKTSGLAKVLGTVICITGAVTMTLYKGTAIHQKDRGFEELHLSFNRLELGTGHWPLGVLCLFLNCTAWGLYLIHQGPALERYPALLSMIASMEFFGCIQVAALGAAYQGTKFLEFRSRTLDQFMIVLYGGIFISAINLVLQAWCVRRVGPFFVSLFSPVQTLLVASMAVLILGDTLYMGILIGGVLIVGGFYIVMLGEQMEQRGTLHTKQSDLEEPLLS